MEDKSVFRFKQFTIAHHQCAMKVGADAVLLGAWAYLPATCQTVLDIGAGSGVIALMLAQRTTLQTQIYGIEIDPQAAQQAQENAQNSPWANRVQIASGNFTHYPTLFPQRNFPMQYNLIVSNPPYYQSHLPAQQQARHTARHTALLSYHDLISGAAALLHPEGFFCLILPHPQGLQFRQMAAEQGLYCHRATAVHTLAYKPIKRWLLQLGKTPPTQTIEDTLIMGGAHPTQFSLACQALTQDFYTVL